MTKRKKYSKEFKLDAISLVLEQGYTRIEAARSLEINATMLGQWHAEPCAGGDQKAQGPGQTARTGKKVLKEATVFFAKETK